MQEYIYIIITFEHILIKFIILLQRFSQNFLLFFVYNLKHSTNFPRLGYRVFIKTLKSQCSLLNNLFSCGSLMVRSNTDQKILPKKRILQEPINDSSKY